MDLTDAYNRTVEGLTCVPVDNFLQKWGCATTTRLDRKEGTLGDFCIDTDTGSIYVYSGVQWLALKEG